MAFFNPEFVLKFEYQAQSIPAGVKTQFVA